MTHTGKLLAPVPYGATKWEVQREASESAPAHRVATFDDLEEARAYVALEDEMNHWKTLYEAAQNANSYRQSALDSLGL
jgi:hypothetical protein